MRILVGKQLFRFIVIVIVFVMYKCYSGLICNVFKICFFRDLSFCNNCIFVTYLKCLVCNDSFKYLLFPVRPYNSYFVNSIFLTQTKMNGSGHTRLIASRECKILNLSNGTCLYFNNTSQTKQIVFRASKVDFYKMIVFMNCFIFINSRYSINITNNYIKITIVVEVTVCHSIG